MLVDSPLAVSSSGFNAVALGTASQGRTLQPARADHVHPVTGLECCLAKLVGANFNSAADQALTMSYGTLATCLITRIRVTSASLSLSTAQGGLYSAASKGGIALVAASQAYAALTGTGLGLDLTLTPAGQGLITSLAALYLSLTTAQGAAATANVYVMGVPLS